MFTPRRSKGTVVQRKMTEPNKAKRIRKVDKLGPEIGSSILSRSEIKKPNNTKELLNKINAFDNIEVIKPEGNNSRIESLYKKSCMNTTKNTSKSKKSKGFKPSSAQITSLKSVASSKLKSIGKPKTK